MSVVPSVPCHFQWWHSVVPIVQLPFTVVALCSPSFPTTIHWNWSVSSHVSHDTLYNCAALCLMSNICLVMWVFMNSGLPMLLTVMNLFIPGVSLSHNEVALLYVRYFSASYWGNSALLQVYYFLSLTCVSPCLRCSITTHGSGSVSFQSCHCNSLE